MQDYLQCNLDALAKVDEHAASVVRGADAHPGLVWSASRQAGACSAALTEEEADGRAVRVTLAGRFNPLDEAGRLADTADLDKHATIVSCGFGLGYHIERLADRVAGKGLLVVFEPDAAVLRAVLERMDYSRLLSHPAVVLLVGDVGDAELTRRLEPRAALITQGVQFITHPPTRRRHSEAVRAFTERFARLAAFCRTNMATTLVNAAVTCRNLTHNLGRYAAGDTVSGLHRAAAGRPAVLVAAGPGLARNIHLLTRPGVRDRVVIIAAQTVLKPLLDRGVRPHFVTALDYHEISRRFYEDLPDNLADVTLVAEPKAHRAVLDHYPGPVRVLQNKFLDLLLGPLARSITPMPAGSTVAHLSFYLAQHLGCDPIILTGQDLGFTDGLYYCPGTAIHDVWAPELNPFNTIEMMEWKRIARHKAHLRKRTDQRGRPIYTDEQMLTYLAQFERDFAAAERAGQTIIDATEGGLPKQHAQIMPLADALDQYAADPLPTLPLAASHLDPGRLTDTAAHLRHRIGQVDQLRQTSRSTLPILERMLADQRDQKKMNAHFAALEEQRKRVAELSEPFRLVNELNQVGVFNRVRADRNLKAADDADPYERQARQLDRDIENVRWLIDGCDETLDIFHEAIERIDKQIDGSSRVDSPTLAAGEVA